MGIDLPLVMPKSVRTTSTSLHSSWPGKVLSSPSSSSEECASSLLRAGEGCSLWRRSAAEGVDLDSGRKRPIERAWPI